MGHAEAAVGPFNSRSMPPYGTICNGMEVVRAVGDLAGAAEEFVKSRV